MAREPAGRTARDRRHAFATHACLGWLSLFAHWFLCLFLMMLVIKSRILGMLGRCSTIELHPQPLLFFFFLKIEFHYVSQACLKLFCTPGWPRTHYVSQMTLNSCSSCLGLPSPRIKGNATTMASPALVFTLYITVPKPKVLKATIWLSRPDRCRKLRKDRFLLFLHTV